MKYLFPFEKVSQNAKVILYGSGEAGYDFYQQIKTSGYCEIIAWVDKQYEWYQYLELPIIPPEQADWMKADMVVIAVTNPKHFNEIKNTLMEWNLKEQQIIWKENYDLVEVPVARLDSNRRKKEMLRARECDPRSLLRANRMDVAIRYLYAKELLQGIENGEGCHLYEKFFETVGAKEPVSNKIFAYFSDYEQKEGIDAYKTAFQKLIFSMKEHGFEKEYFIPLDKHGELVNGAHRVAAAMALDTPVWVVDFPLFEGFHYDFSYAWLEDNGFDQRERMKIKERETT